MGILEGHIAEKRQQVIIDSGWLHSLMLRGFPLDNYNSKTMKYSRYSKVRRKNMRCTKMECDMAKAFVGAFQNIIEDNKRMKDALISFHALLDGNNKLSFLLDCHDDELNKLMNIVYKGIQELKEKCNGNTRQD